MISFKTRLFIGIFFKARDSFQREYFFRNYDAAKNFISSTRFYDSNNIRITLILRFLQFTPTTPIN